MATATSQGATMKSVLKRIVRNTGTPEEPIYVETGQTQLWFECPGCGGMHALNVSLSPEQEAAKLAGAGGPPKWSWDGNLEAPTVSPSILSSYEYGENRQKRVCHSFLNAGRMQFLDDCTHDKKGQTVPLPDVPDWLAKEAEDRGD